MKSFDRVSLVFAIAMLVFMPYAVAAQETGTGRLTGVVKDAQGAAIPNAGIAITGAKTGAEFQAHTDASGTWTVAGLPADSYTVTATAPATVPGTLRDLTVAAGTTTTASTTVWSTKIRPMNVRISMCPASMFA